MNFAESVIGKSIQASRIKLGSGKDDVRYTLWYLIHFSCACMINQINGLSF